MYTFSIILPVFNRTSSLTRATQSVINQSYSDWELIVVDDGSSPPVSGLPDDPRIKLVRIDTNSGVSNARNKGVEKASGDYVAFLDSDDEFLPHKLDFIIGYIAENNCHENILLFSTAYVYQKGSDASAVVPSVTYTPGERAAHYLFLKGGFMLTPTLVTSLKKARECQFDTRFSIHEDYGFILGLEAQGVKIAMIKEPLTRWHLDGENEQLSQLSNYDESYRWLQSVKHLLNDAEIAAFTVSVLAPAASKEQPMAGIPIYLKHIGSCENMPLTSQVQCLVKTFSPSIYRRLISAFINTYASQKEKKFTSI